MFKVTALELVSHNLQLRHRNIPYQKTVSLANREV